MDVENDSPTAALVIRPATASDYDQIFVVWEASGLNVCADGRESREAFNRQVAQFPALYLVATDAGRVVGVVLGSHDHRKGWINRLAVLPEYRRRGIASSLVRACDTAIRRFGIEVVSALVEPPNDASFAVFEKLGFDTLRVRYFRKASRPGA